MVIYPISQRIVNLWSQDKIFRIRISLWTRRKKTLRSGNAKCVSIRPYPFEPAVRKKCIYNADAASYTKDADSESAEKTAAESVSAAPIKHNHSL